jgi:hypothetical protein
MSITSQSRSPSLSVAPAGVPPRRQATGPIRVRLDRAYLRLIAFWKGTELDRQLAAGIDPHTTEVLALRAERITERRSRTRVANGLARALSIAQETAPGLTAAVRPRASK